MNELNTVLLFLSGMNLIAFILMGVDKQKAIKHQYRISERTLWMVAIMGGAFGALAGMKVFRHKTKHRAFVIGMPFFMAVHLFMIGYFFLYLS